MEQIQTNSLKPSRLANAWMRWRGRSGDLAELDALPCIPIPAARIRTLDHPAAYRETLLALIAGARRRIFIATLYLQDDDAGREILAALYAARKAQPQLEIAVFVDWHRAQRGLIGKKRSPGNAALYKEMARRLGPGVTIYGVPVQRREFMGVMHLKGLVIDDCVLYSGASLNDVYLHRHARYRLDRYHVIENAALADSLVGLLRDTISRNQAVNALESGRTPSTVAIRNAIVRFRRVLGRARYDFSDGLPADDEVGVTPLLGLGLRGNELNTTILQLIHRATTRLVVFTPYFNLPGPVRRALDGRIRAGCHVTIVLGDKTANDFYIPPDEPFKTIGALPYLYEANLRRYAKARQRHIDAGLLDIQLWQDADNTFHLKGLLVDDDYTLLTGNNINPRAWRLDLENGLLIRDPQHRLADLHRAELTRIMEHTARLNHYDEIETVDAYPLPVQRLVKRLARVRADRLVNQML